MEKYKREMKCANAMVFSVTLQPLRGGTQVQASNSSEQFQRTLWRGYLILRGSTKSSPK